MTISYDVLEKAITDGDIQTGVTESLKMVDSGTKPLEIFSDCIEPVLADVGDRFSRLEIFLPEMISSAEVVKAIETIMAQQHVESEWYANPGDTKEIMKEKRLRAKEYDMMQRGVKGNSIYPENKQ